MIPVPPMLTTILPSPYMLELAARKNKKLRMVEEKIILHDRLHRFWSDRWLNARWDWWARFCIKRMDGCVLTITSWELSDD